MADPLPRQPGTYVAGDVRSARSVPGTTAAEEGTGAGASDPTSHIPDNRYKYKKDNMDNIKYKYIH